MRTIERADLPHRGRARPGSGLRPLLRNVVVVGIFWLGFAAVARPWTSFTIWRFPAVFVVAGGLAVIGWRERVRVSYAVRAYVTLALLLSAWLLISSTSAWEYLSFYRWRNETIWLLFTVPGVAFLLRDRSNQRAFATGIFSGAAILGLGGAARVVLGRQFLDVQTGDAAIYPEFFGINRNLAATVVVAALPFVLASPLPGVLRRLRLPVAGLIVAFVLLSGSRGGLISLGVVALALALVQPTTPRLARALYAVLLCGTLTVIAVQQIGGEAATSLDRLGSTVRGESTESDEIRRLVLRKAWNIALDHPVTGIGLGNFRGSEDEVLDAATTQRVSEQAAYQADHNAYAGRMAEAGFPGAVLFVVMLLVLLRLAIVHRRSASVRVATGSFAVVLFALFFGLTISDRLTFLTLAAVLGAIIDAERSGPKDDRITSPPSYVYD